MSAEDSKKFSIQMAASMAGLSAHTIRAWEKRYQALTPARTDNGRRLYSAQEVDRLILLAQLTHLGSNISQVANLSDDDLRSMYSKVVQSGDYFPPSIVKQNINIPELKSQLLSSVAKYEVNVISQLLSQAKNSVAPKIFAMEILKPLIEEVKRSKFQNAQVQALLALAKFHAGNIIYSHFEKNIKSSHNFVLTGLEKENHSFSLLVSALLCCHHKKHFYYLNTNLPVASIIDAVNAVNGNILILSVPENTESVSKLLEEVTNQLSPKVKIWTVGSSQESVEKLDKMLETLA